MSDAPILDLAGVGKSYRGYGSLWWRAAGWITGHPSHFTDHWVLRDVSFALRRGEAVGVVGRNGAGKSTLLKIIAGTLTPTEGQVAVHGKVSAILELGMGFNREFTGRENVVHSCGLLGYEPARVQEILPWIESFADVGEYFDQPMRTYSSGMNMRVAFAVATAVRPDILIVDEALSVGDAAFQRKSFRRIEEFIADGTSLLFVSHGTDAVKRLCERAVWLDHGHVAMQGSSKQVVDEYERVMLGAAPLPAQVDAASSARGFIDPALNSSIESQYGGGQARIDGFAIQCAGGAPANTVAEGEPFDVTYHVQFLADCREVEFGFMVKTIDGVCVYAANTAATGSRLPFRSGDTALVRFSCVNNLMPAVYFLNVGVTHEVGKDRVYLHRRVDVAALRVQGDRPFTTGIANLRAQVSVVVRAEEDLGTVLPVGHSEV